MSLTARFQTSSIRARVERFDCLACAQDRPRSRDAMIPCHPFPVAEASGRRVRRGHGYRTPIFRSARRRAAGVARGGGGGAAQIGRAHAELQSLRSITYAVYCLTKKTIKISHILT